MKIPASLALLVLAACQAPSSGAPRARLAEPSGLEQVTIVSKGLE